jgi:hypothetical protein
MGMTIDEAIKEIESITVVTDEKQALAFALAVHTMKKYQMMQADYENRLKADMVAMLEELQLEIEEKFNDRPFSYNHHQRTEFYRDIDEIIQQKINSLKEA